MTHLKIDDEILFETNSGNKGVPKSSVYDQENPYILWNASGYCRRYTTVLPPAVSESAEPNQRPQSVLMLSFD